MVLTLHIFFAIVGTLVVYAQGLLFLHTLHSSASHFQKRTAVYIFLFGVILTGIALFQKNPDALLASPRFLSNMSVMMVILFLELLQRFSEHRLLSIIVQLLIIFSWTWILSIALLNPSYAYAHIILVYAIFLFCTGAGGYLYFKKYDV